jgi:SAM-dependent methyltransferase
VGRALNVGCGGRLTVSASKPYFERGYEVIGLDVSEEYLRDYRREYGCDVIQANGVALPFRSGSFDLVNFTDILEHLHHPLVGLGEVHRVLKDGGVIILVTPNRHTIEGRNPLVPIEKAVSLCQDSILRPRRILEQWMGLDLYHTEFSRREIEGMVKAAGLEIWGFETRFFVDSMVWRAMNAAFRRLPVLRHMCWSSAVIAKKSMAPSKP